MIRKVLVLIILGCVFTGMAAPALASGMGDSGGSGSADSGGSSSGNGGSPDSGSSSGNGGSPDSGSSSGNGGSSDSGSSSGSSDQGKGGSQPTSESTQSQERSQTQEPSGVPTQEQSQDQSRTQTPGTSLPGAVPTREQSQSQDQTHLEDQYLQQVHDRQSQLSQDRQLVQDQQRLNVDVALYSVTVAEPVIGPNGTSFNQLAREINQSYAVLDQAQTRIQDRNPVVRFFLGGDAASAQTILNITAQDQDRIRLMEQDLQSCSCNQTIRDQLQQQLNTLSQDQDRLRTLANQTLQDRGVFGGFLR